MEENTLILMTEGFTPKSFINITDEEVNEVIEETGLADIVNSDVDALYEEWTQAFKTVNAEVIGNLPDGLDISRIPTTDIQDEVYKVSEIIGHTVTFIHLNISEKNWFNIITEYLVYMSNSIGSVAGSIFYWLTMQHFFQEDGVEHAKSKQLLHFIDKNYEFVTNHKYYDEVNMLAKIFPFELLNVEELDLTDIASVFLLYPNGNLNRFVSEHFSDIPKILSKQFISQILDGHIKSTLGDFSIEEMWKEGNAETIRDFLKEGIIHKNNIANYSLLNSSTPSYIDTIKKWIGNQIDVLKDLNEVEKLEIAKPQNQEADEKIQAKYYALYHLILVELKKEKDFARDDSDKYSRKDIENFAKRTYPNISAQGFYRGYINNDISDKETIVSDNKDFKEKLSIIAKNNPDVLRYLKQFPR